MNYTKNPGVHRYWCCQDMGILLKNRAKTCVFTNVGCQYLAMKGIPPSGIFIGDSYGLK